LRWKVLAVVLVLISAGSALALVPQGQGPADVTVQVVCPQDLNTGQLIVRVRPWIYQRTQGEDSTWRLATNRPQENEITIEAKDGSAWPYAETQKSGPSSVVFTDMTGGTGDYDYNIIIYCDGERVVIDPRMKVE